MACITEMGTCISGESACISGTLNDPPFLAGMQRIRLGPNLCARGLEIIDLDELSHPPPLLGEDIRTPSF